MEKDKHVIGEKISLRDRYEFVVQARKFHYENFNKWMTYFYLAIAALFVGYYTVLTKTPKIPESENAKVVILILGFITSIFWYWSSKGYYYWNIHFVTLVNYYEAELLELKDHERIYFVFSNKQLQNSYISPISGANISTSKIAIFFAFVISCTWGYLFFNNLSYRYSVVCVHSELMASVGNLLIAIVTVLLFSIFIPEYCLFSRIDDFPDLEIDKTGRRRNSSLSPAEDKK